MLTASGVSLGMQVVQGVANLSQQVDAAADATYNAVYSNKIQQYNLSKAQSAARKNISATLQDKINTVSSIQVQRDQAKASIEVNAAAAGVSGGSVDAALYNADRSASFAINYANEMAEQSVESLANNIGELEGQKVFLNKSTESTVSQISDSVSGWDAITQFATEDFMSTLGDVYTDYFSADTGEG